MNAKFSNLKKGQTGNPDVFKGEFSKIKLCFKRIKQYEILVAGFPATLVCFLQLAARGASVR